MDDSRYLECLPADYGDLRDAAFPSSATFGRPGASIDGGSMPALSDYTGSGQQPQQRVLAIAGVRWPYPPGTPPCWPA